MTAETDKLLKFCDTFCARAEEALEKIADKKKKKLDPKAKVRNRGTVIFSASSCKDKKDHFPINSEAQARNALARSHQYSSVPSWYSGSLSSLQEAVRRKVHSKFPGIEISKDKKKKSSFLLDELLEKYGEALGVEFDDDLDEVEKFAQVGASSAPNEQDLATKINAILQPLGYLVNNVQVAAPDKTIFVKVKALPNAKFQGTGHQGSSIAGALAPVTPPGMKMEPSVEF